MRLSVVLIERAGCLFRLLCHAGHGREVDRLTNTETDKQLNTRLKYRI